MRRYTVCTSLALAGFVSSAAAHELLVGRDAANRIVMHSDAEPFPLDESPFPGFDGFAASDPGFVALGADRPTENIFALPGTADLEFTLIADEPHIQVWNDTGTAPMEIGESFTMGQPLFHVHPIWHSPDGTPGETYTLHIRLHDLSGQLSDSASYPIAFTPVPEPTAAAGLVLAALTVICRRR